MEREELEQYTEQWLSDTDTISNDEYGEIANDYLQTHNHRHSYKLYKYQNPFVSEESLCRFLETLTNHTLGLSAPSTFNAPFDCQHAIPSGYAKAPRAQEAIKSTNDAFFRVGCLAEAHDNRLMWSHYGGSYCGVCIEYDVSTFKPTESECCFAPVIYGKERPKILESSISGQNKVSPLTPEEILSMTRALFTKDDVWKYEREWRIVKMGRFSASPKYLPLTMPITAVYLGPACSGNFTSRNINPDDFKKYVAAILDICEKKQIILQTLKLHPTYYRLELGQRLV